MDKEKVKTTTEEKNQEAWFMHDALLWRGRNEKGGESCNGDGRGPAEVLGVLHRSALFLPAEPAKVTPMHTTAFPRAQH